MSKYLSLSVLLFFLSACMHSSYTCCGSSEFVSVFSEVINKDTRASTHVNAPDPLHQINPHGQRLYVSWRLPKQYKNRDIQGVLKVRFNEPIQEEVPFKIGQLSGTVIYEVINEAYFNRSGVFTYSAEIYVDGQKIDQFKHKMWAELIHIQ